MEVNLAVIYYDYFNSAEEIGYFLIIIIFINICKIQRSYNRRFYLILMFLFTNLLKAVILLNNLFCYNINFIIMQRFF